jgi:D-alanyl-D-alanine carboxypeptidase/D-alanyl-D-alanine-endopeptidase (penicillin-binding protein 4)
MREYITLLVYLLISIPGKAQMHPAIQRFVDAPYMRGASVSLMIKDMSADSVVYQYDADRKLIPASVLKVVTTATALELLGADFRYKTAIMYDGNINDSTLYGNIYVYGSGDPALCSSETGLDQNKIIRVWMDAIKAKGIKKINGAVIADESIFDTEGVSMKWMREDLGSYYGQGSYGLNIFDNRFSLFLNTGEPNSKPHIERSDPDMSSILYHNYLVTSNTSKDSSYIVGFPYSPERYLYGVVPPNRPAHQLVGDMPDPPLFIATFITNLLNQQQIPVSGTPTSYRILSEAGKWIMQNRIALTTTYSPSLHELIRITNHVSHNLYADALLKTIGVTDSSAEFISSFDKGINRLHTFWREKGLDTSSLWIFDGSGLAHADKVNAEFLCSILTYMATKSSFSTQFIESLPRAGKEGTVRTMFVGTRLEGIARLKSGSMSRVRSYSGYIPKEGKQFAVAILVNNFSCSQIRMKMDIEQLILDLF